MAPSNGTPIMSPNGSATHSSTKVGAPTEDHVASLWSRYEHLKYQDVMKNVLLEVRRLAVPSHRSTADSVA